MFYEDEFKPMQDSEVSEKKLTSDKIYKIKYSVLLLPILGMHFELSGSKT